MEAKYVLRGMWQYRATLVASFCIGQYGHYNELELDPEISPDPKAQDSANDKTFIQS